MCVSCSRSPHNASAAVVPAANERGGVSHAAAVGMAGVLPVARVDQSS